MPQAIHVETGDSPKPNRAERRAKASDDRRSIRPKFISIIEACDYLGCSRSHFYEELLGKLKSVRLGKRRLVELDSLDQLADSLPAAE